MTDLTLPDPPLGTLFSNLLAKLFGLPQHTVDDGLKAHLAALDEGLAAVTAHLTTLDADDVDADAKIAAVAGQINGIGAALKDFANSPVASAPTASAPTATPTPAATTDAAPAATAADTGAVTEPVAPADGSLAAETSGLAPSA